MQSQLIHSYIEQYKKNLGEYLKLESQISSSINSLLESSGIMGLVTSRIKKPDRLAEKIQKRIGEKHYKNHVDITRDIKDIIGVRVALYFPNDQERFQSICRNYFHVIETKHFPRGREKKCNYTYQFPGYCATHYIVQIDSKRTSDNITQVFEIQIASLLMHAWAEVEHDLVYKEKKGTISYDELESLDELNGLVITGQISLQRLQRVFELRTASENRPFSNQYQLASFLFEKIEDKKGDGGFILGNVETLFRIFEDIDRLTPKKVSNNISDNDFDYDKPIAQQLIDIYARDNKRVTDLVISLNTDQTLPDEIYSYTVGIFITKWVKLEKSLDFLAKKHKQSSNYGSIRRLLNELILDKTITQDFLVKYKALREIRNTVVHGNEFLGVDYLKGHMNEIDSLTKYLKEKVK